MSFFKTHSIVILFTAILAVGAIGCTPVPSAPADVNISPQSPAVTSNTASGQATVTVTPSPNLPEQPVVGPVSPPIVTPVPVPPIANTPGSYPNSSLLVDTKWVAEHIADQNLVIIDARPASNYAAGHINGAINLPPGVFDGPGATAGDNTDIKNPTELADIFGKAGVSNTNRIVVYSAGNEYAAARIFWMLEYLGHKDVHILNGGYTKWNQEGNYAVTHNTIRTATTFTPVTNASVVAKKADVLASLNNTNFVRVDSRNAADFIVKRIPDSINILMADYLNADLTIKSFADMNTFLNSKGITPGKNVIANCYVGYRSSQAYFVFRLMGYIVSNYDGSTTEWFADPMLPTQP